MPPEANDNRLSSETRLWQGFEEYMDSPEFREAMTNEFPEDAAEWTDPVSRRNFIGLMGASLALAGAVGCSPRPAPTRKIVPYTRQPDQMTLGVPLFFASACPVAGYVTGVVVRSNEGRPTKIEGNPDHPSSLGGTGLFEQASILDLYDPDRSMSPARRGQPIAYDELITALRKEFDRLKKKGDKGKGLRIVTGAITSPTVAAQFDELLKAFPEAKWVQHEPCGQDSTRAGAAKAFGQEVAVTYDFRKADVVLALDADFLGSGPGCLRYSRDFASRRRIRNTISAGQENEYVAVKADEKKKLQGMSRLYVVECMPSITGSVADHRLAVPSSQVDLFARVIAAKLGVAGVAHGPYPSEMNNWVGPLVNDLNTAKGRCVVVVGECQPPHVHAIAHAINSKLGNIGQTVHTVEPIEVRPKDKVIDLPTLVKEIKAKAVDSLLVLGGTNPAYTAPADVDFVGAMKELGKDKKFTFHLGSHLDETAALCEWHVNEAHYLETWGDGRGHDGTVAIQQPLIAPLYAGKSVLELLADVDVSGKHRESRELVKATWRKWYGEQKNDSKGEKPEFEEWWQEVVRSGVVKGTAAAPAKAALSNKLDLGNVSPTPAAGEFEINFRPDPALFDGRYANNGWLQELPRPVTKMSWDNAAYVSMNTFKSISDKLEPWSLENERGKFPHWTAGERGRMEMGVLELEFKGRKMKLPVWPLPGHPDNAVTVHLGFGRERAGRVANPTVDATASGRIDLVAIPNIESTNAEGKLVHGSNAYALRTTDALWHGAGLKVTPTAQTYFLACLQAHWSMQQTDPLDHTIIKRRPVRHQSVGEYDINPWYGKIGPAAIDETQAIAHNTPGPAGKGEPAESGTQQALGTSYGPHSHDDEEKGKHKHDERIIPLTMYQPNERLYPGSKGAHRWGMAIDLSACTGCNACVLACQSENNTPVVGKREVTRGHDMYWIRIDRYYEGSQEAPVASQTFFQPVPCQQCEKAPCEVVCPVGATAHSIDGLNDMTYNRCVGTRYCSNNCPYKVRRFNFITFQDWTTESIKLGRNPDVTVRSRGVMEKCTYCVQRIRYAEVVAEREARPIADGEIRTACQSACPSGAIVFGDLNDANSVVGKWKSEPANYGLLAELNTMPRTSYLTSVRNPNPELK
ncbi:MAG TPA: TAT-variant-translocated molybdopterin oxidoreductase [Gemmataceae bacterium]